MQELVFAINLSRFDEIFALFVLINKAADVSLHLAFDESASLNLLLQRLNLGVEFGDALVLL